MYLYIKCLPAIHHSTFFLHVFINFVVPWTDSYSCQLFSMCRAYPDWRLLFSMYLMFSWNLTLRLRPVWPIYFRLHILPLRLYMPFLVYVFCGCLVCSMLNMVQLSFKILTVVVLPILWLMLELYVRYGFWVMIWWWLPWRWRKTPKDDGTTSLTTQ